MKAHITLFEDYQIRRVYDKDAVIWWLSVIDIVQVLKQRMPGQEIRNKLTDHWADHDIKLREGFFCICIRAPCGLGKTRPHGGCLRGSKI